MKFGIISDIHEDVVRLKEALREAEKHRCDEIICLGDIIGFNYPNFGFYDTRNASECIGLVRENCKYIVAGNHDFYSVNRLPEHAAGFPYPDNWYDLDYNEKKTLAGDRVWVMEVCEFDPLIGKDEKEYMRTIPEWLVIPAGDYNILATHYLYPDLPGLTATYYEQFGPVQDHLEYIGSKDCLIGFSGHKHIEGATLFTEKEEASIPFGSRKLERELQWIVGPCVANGKKMNGLMVFDAAAFHLEVIPLKTPPRMMQTVYV